MLCVIEHYKLGPPVLCRRLIFLCVGDQCYQRFLLFVGRLFQFAVVYPATDLLHRGCFYTSSEQIRIWASNIQL